MNVVEVQGLGLRLNGIPILEDVSMAIPQGDFVALIGPNGAGKSTLLKAILGLQRVDTGTIRIFGQDAGSFKGWHRVGYLQQHATSFDPRFPASVWEIASLGRVARRGLMRFLSEDDRRAVASALFSVGMTEKASKRIGELSGGEKQRVLIARALAAYPELLILDEPTAGVDPGTQEQFYEFLRKLNEEQGLTILLASHDLGAVFRIVKTVACINRWLVYHGSPGEGLTAEKVLQTYGSTLGALTHIH